MAALANCSQLVYDGVVTTADADIAGIGVIVAFLLSAYLTFFAVVIAFARGLVDEGLLRAADLAIWNPPARAQQRPRMHKALRQFVLTLSDQQIITGIAILGAGFQGLRLRTISVYHFQIVIYLAWMSSSVHLSALTLLSPYLKQHKGVMAWRLTGMFVLLILLLVALVPTVSYDWDVAFPQNDEPPTDGKSGMGVPARCFFGAAYSPGVNPDSLISFGVLIVSYVWKFGGIFSPVRMGFKSYLFNPLESFIERGAAYTARKHKFTRTKLWLWAFRLWIAVFLPGLAVFEVMSSFSAALWLSALGLVYGTLQVIIPRAINLAQTPGLAAAENSLGFGQLTPLILLVQPLSVLMEYIWIGGDRDTYEMRRVSSDEDTLSTSNDIQSYKLRLRTSGLSDRPFINFMADYDISAWTETAESRMYLKAYLYTSRLFKLLIWLVHAGTAATAGILFYSDYFTIGQESSDNWVNISFAIAAWAFGWPIIMLCCLPFSRIGRSR